MSNVRAASNGEVAKCNQRLTSPLFQSPKAADTGQMSACHHNALCNREFCQFTDTVETKIRAAGL